MKFFTSFLFVALVLASCGTEKYSASSEHPADTTNDPFVDSSKIYGRWESTGFTEDGAQMRLRVTFAPGEVSATKTCTYTGSGSTALTVNANAKSLDNADNTIAQLVGGLYARTQVSQYVCTIDFWSSLEFVLRDDKIYVRLSGTEKVTGLKRLRE